MGKTKKRGGKNEKTDQERQQNTQKRPKNDENLKKVVCSIRKAISISDPRTVPTRTQYIHYDGTTVTACPGDTFNPTDP